MSGNGDQKAPRSKHRWLWIGSIGLLLLLAALHPAEAFEWVFGILYWYGLLLLPFWLPLGLVLFPLLSWKRSWCSLRRALALDLVLVALLLAFSFSPLARARWEIARGNAHGHYQLARWFYNRGDNLATYALRWLLPEPWVARDRDACLAELRAGRVAGDIESLYALGVFYDQGMVPEPPHWHGPGGNVFPQPETGGPMIEEAVRKGFRPAMKEDRYLYDVFEE